MEIFPNAVLDLLQSRPQTAALYTLYFLRNRTAIRRTVYFVRPTKAYAPFISADLILWKKGIRQIVYLQMWKMYCYFFAAAV